MCSLSNHYSAALYHYIIYKSTVQFIFKLTIFFYFLQVRTENYPPMKTMQLEVFKTQFNTPNLKRRQLICAICGVAYYVCKSVGEGGNSLICPNVAQSVCRTIRISSQYMSAYMYTYTKNTHTHTLSRVYFPVAGTCIITSAARFT